MDESIGYFDPKLPVAELTGNLPHWRQEGTTYFVTFRLADSIPQSKIWTWQREEQDWLARNPEPHSVQQRREYHDRFTNRFQRWLDQGFGSCLLSDTETRKIVEAALRHFDNDRYSLGDWVVMPNHVHVVVTPLAEYELSKILKSWKSYTAHQINGLLHRSGNLWQKESFDHIIRSPEQLERIAVYIRENPKHLPPGTYSLSK